MSNFPWDKLKAETLRAICTDLGFPRTFYTKEIMVGLIKMTEDSGLEQSIEHEQELYEAKNEEKSTQITPRARRSERGAPVMSNYDTRHKKRRRVSEPAPKTARSQPARVSATTTTDEPPRKRRGRPPKVKPQVNNPPSQQTKISAPPSSTRREVFAGVVLTAPSSMHRGKAKVEHYEDYDVGDEDAEGDIDMEHEDDGLIPDIQIESSLASSNKGKQNEFDQQESSQGDDVQQSHQLSHEYQRGPSFFLNHFPPVNPSSAHIDDVLENPVRPLMELPLETVSHPGTESVATEGFLATPVDSTSQLSASKTPQFESGLTQEDVNNVEEVLRAVAANGHF
ncbi:hypothetical protein H0H93_001717 [Arthromyces matolae]|nr:hypothetical protein H0H93_001717 [Arthromyces matolae]